MCAHKERARARGVGLTHTHTHTHTQNLHNTLTVAKFVLKCHDIEPM